MLTNRQDNAELVETVRVGLGLWRNVWNGDVRNGYDALTELAERLEDAERALRDIALNGKWVVLPGVDGEPFISGRRDAIGWAQDRTREALGQKSDV